MKVSFFMLRTPGGRGIVANPTFCQSVSQNPMKLTKFYYLRGVQIRH